MSPAKDTTLKVQAQTQSINERPRSCSRRDVMLDYCEETKLGLGIQK